MKKFFFSRGLILMFVMLFTQAAAAQTLLRTYVGEAANDRFTYEMVGVGDVNGDGYQDFAIGAVFKSSEAGKIYVYLGGATIPTTPSYVITDGAGGQLGGRIASGDVNGDGYSDIIASHIYFNSNAGKVYVYYGGPTPSTTVNVTLLGESIPNGLLGYFVASADLNNDGFSDVIATAPNAPASNQGRVYIYYGGTNMDAVVDQTITGDVNGGFGWALQTDDFNNDGNQDLAVGSPSFNGYAGRVSLFYGTGSGINTTAGLTFSSEGSNHQFGSNITSLDFNGDGYADLVVGAPFAQGRAGKVYVFFGGSSMDATPDLTQIGTNTSDPLYGNKLANAYDINNDGYEDLLASEQNLNNQRGVVYVYYGGSSPNLSPDYVINGTVNQEWLGARLAGVGDVNNDGRNEFLIGGELFNAFTGRAHLYQDPTAPTGSVAVTSPNGGEVVIEGRTKAITWTSSAVSNVKLEYSTNNGTNWIEITASTAAAAGTYNWTVPSAATSQALVRVSDASNANLNDVSNAVFTINLCSEPSWSINPANFEYSMNIVGKLHFEATPSENLLDKVAVYVGAELRGFANVSHLSGNEYRVYLTVYSNQESGEKLYFQPWKYDSCLTFPRISQRFLFSADGVLGSVANPQTLTATTTLPAVTVTAPNGGESFLAGYPTNITWSSSNVDSVKIEFSSDNGSNWSTVQSVVAAGAGTYAWTVPSVTTSSALVRVVDAFNNSYGDSSNAVFSIAIPSLTVTSPNGGESWVAGTSQNITWSSSNLSNVKVEYSTDNGSNYTTISASTAASAGSLAWSVPVLSSSQALVRISDVDNASFNDVSNAVFSIVTPTITLTSRNGGDTVYAGNSTAITWTSSNMTTVKIEYSSDNGSNYSLVTAGTPASGGTYSWTVPSITSTQVLVRVSDSSNASFSDVSDAVFAILNPSVTVTAPNGGESWVAGSSQNITWTSSDIANVKLEYSSDNGTNWNTVAASVTASAGTYAWTVPSISTFQALVRVSSAANASYSDVSNAVFAIGSSSAYSLVAGWSWISFNVVPSDFSLNTVLAGLNPATNDLIKNQTSFSQYLTGTGWVGTLSNLSVTSAFLIKLANAGSMNVFGAVQQPSSTPITLNSGWTYISFVPAASLSVTAALASLTPNNADVVKSQYAFAIFDSTYGWVGNLSSMQPKVGYFLKKQTGGTLTYPDPVEQENTPVFAQEINRSVEGHADWTVDINSYPSSMVIVAKVNEALAGLIDSETILGAFSEGVCRGFVKAKYLEYRGETVFFLTVYGGLKSAEDVLSFRLLNPASGTELTVDQKLNFAADEVIGDMKNLYILSSNPSSAQDGTVPTIFDLGQNYPNPFNPSTLIRFSVPTENFVEISVFNIMGEKVKTLIQSSLQAGSYSVNWDGTNDAHQSVTTGLYIYRMQAGDFVATKKAVFIK